MIISAKDRVAIAARKLVAACDDGREFVHRRAVEAVVQDSHGDGVAVCIAPDALYVLTMQAATRLGRTYEDARFLAGEDGGARLDAAVFADRIYNHPLWHEMVAQILAESVAAVLAQWDEVVADA